jgi:hypothetical protein
LYPPQTGDPLLLAIKLAGGIQYVAADGVRFFDQLGIADNLHVYIVYIFAALVLSLLVWR